MPNPVTDRNRKRLLELLDKERLSLEEADELREIAWRFVEEYGGERREPWKLLIYASIMRGIALRRLGEERAQ